jgi:hypothetical protein
MVRRVRQVELRKTREPASENEPRSVTQPPMLVPFPQKYFVVECRVKSTPFAAASKRYGVPNVLSQATGTPASCAAATIASISGMLARGFATDSK